MEKGEASTLLGEAELPLGFVCRVQAGLEPLRLANLGGFCPKIGMLADTLPVIWLGKLLWI